MVSKSRGLLVIALSTGSMLYSMGTQNPMDADWFYRDDNPYKTANMHLQERKWPQAEQAYQTLLDKKAGSEQDQDMAALNLASAQMAQRKASAHWQAFGRLCGIPADRLFTQADLARISSEKEEGNTVTVHSNMVGIGDIAHFLPVAAQLKDKGVDVRLAVRKFMHTPLQGPSQTYGVPLIDEKEVDSTEGYQTHLVALYGLLNVAPHDLASEKALYTTTESAVAKVRDALAPHREISIVFLGEDRQATLIGGKQLPFDTNDHGRQLDAKAFEDLLKQHPNLILLDCNPDKSRISFYDDTDDDDDTINNRSMSAKYKDKVIGLPAETTPFDSVIALGLIWNQEEQRFVGFAGDNGPPNLFARTLDEKTQRRFVYIIPNGSEYDMRMEGDGKKYVQMLSHCPVYRCDNPAEQAETMITAYNDITQKAKASTQKVKAYEPSTEPDGACAIL